MRVKSLSTRLVLVSLGWSAFALVAIGIILASTFRETVERRFDDTLNVYLSILIAQLAERGDTPLADVAASAGDPRFMLPLSGWYWSVWNYGEPQTVAASESLVGDTLAVAAADVSLKPGELFKTYVNGPADERLRLIAGRIMLDDGRWLLVATSGEAASIEADTTRFGTRLVLILSLFACFLVIVTFVQWRMALDPLRTLWRELAKIQEGGARRVGRDYPREIQPMTEALNALLETNQATLERARQHVGNLAHALKTPLSVLLNDAAQEETPLARSVREQAQTMQRQVRYYLERAQMAAKQRMIGATTDVRQALERLHRAMSRLGERRGIEVNLWIDGTPRFAGEQQDFEEIVGNLLDNGLKWARTRIDMRVEAARTTLLGRAGMLRIVIEDDGPGLTEAQRKQALSRGQRIDQSKPGSGLGLSIVSELVELYGGTLNFDRSSLGGLLVVIILPRA